MKIDLNISIADVLAAVISTITSGRVTVGPELSGSAPRRQTRRSRPRRKRLNEGARHMKRMRELAGWTQKELGTAVGRDQATISNYESGAARVPEKMKQSIVFHLCNDEPPQRAEAAPTRTVNPQYIQRTAATY